MTAITGRIAPTRRKDALGVHSMDSFHMSVPDLAVAETFYKDFGLDVREDGNGLSVYTFGSDHRWMSLDEGAKKKMSFQSFGVFEDDFERFRRHVEGQGIKLEDPPIGFERNGFWFRDHDGNLIEIKVAEKSSPNAKSDWATESVAANERGAFGRSAASLVRPVRLAHLLIFTTDVEAAIQFYARVLGMRLSDRVGDGIAFMHGVHGSDHHMVAFAKSDGPGLHHVSWDVPSIDNIGVGAMHLADTGHTQGWGTGRHVLGSNYFHYVRDPWGSYSEYSSDIDYVSVDHDWESDDHDGDDAFYLWGPTPPKDFTHNYETSD
jgi:catechol 2,3-dioxygenase